MGKKKKELPSLSPTLPIDLSSEAEPALLTAMGGLPLVAQTFRTLGLHDSVERHVVVKERSRGFSESEVVESLVLLHAAGGDCVDDLRRLKADEGLEPMLGHAIPSPEMVRTFLERFHSDEAVAAAKAERKAEQIAFIPKETPPLEGLARVNDDLVRETARRMTAQRIATVDADATIQESRKKEALAHYQGGRGYQPQVAVWAETMLVLADEFRDGNVPAGMAPLTVCQRALRALPPTVEQYFYRADSASYEWTLIDWLRNEARPDGPKGLIGFAISADMSQELKAVVVGLPATAWTPYKAPGEELDAERDWADVPFVPCEPSEHKDTQPLRYVGIRIRPRQGTLFADGSEVKYFAVVTNRLDLGGAKLLQWHREKAGTIEQVHDIVKNELGGGVLPSKYFGANAAWFRIALLAHNVLVALKRIALPPELLDARPKRLRFQIFMQAGRLVSHARTLTLRLRLNLERLADLVAAWRTLLAPA